MTQRLLLSAAVLVLVAGVGIGATRSFFSDTETSTGNTFTAGSIDLKVDDTQHYDGLVCQSGLWVLDQSAVTNPSGTTSRPELVGTVCTGSWALKDLVPTVDKFFNFTDVKPGDMGENTISLHIDNNPAWACAVVSNTHNDDNGTTTPEMLAGDITPGAGQGELAQFLNFVVWQDNATSSEITAGNNRLDVGEKVIAAGTMPTTGTTTFPIADSVIGGTPITQNGTSYLGVAWCFGNFTNAPNIGGVGTGAALICDGTGNQNIAQTDSYTADFGINVVQSRNNATFTCGPNEQQIGG